MELSFSQLRAKEVINTQDGRKLGKVCDIVLCYPDNRWVGIIVPGTRGFCAKKNDLFIELKRIVKIGEDVILVNIGLPRGAENGRNANERNGACPPINCSPSGNHRVTNGAPTPCGGGGFVAEPLGRNFEEFE